MQTMPVSDQCISAYDALIAQLKDIQHIAALILRAERIADRTADLRIAPRAKEPIGCRHHAVIQAQDGRSICLPVLFIQQRAADLPGQVLIGILPAQPDRIAPVSAALPPVKIIEHRHAAVRQFNVDNIRAKLIRLCIRFLYFRGRAGIKRHNILLRIHIQRPLERTDVFIREVGQHLLRHTERRQRLPRLGLALRGHRLRVQPRVVHHRACQQHERKAPEEIPPLHHAAAHAHGRIHKAVSRAAQRAAHALERADDQHERDDHRYGRQPALRERRERQHGDQHLPDHRRAQRVALRLDLGAAAHVPQPRAQQEQPGDLHRHARQPERIGRHALQSPRGGGQHQPYGMPHQLHERQPPRDPERRTAAPQRAEAQILQRGAQRGQQVLQIQEVERNAGQRHARRDAADRLAPRVDLLDHALAGHNFAQPLLDHLIQTILFGSGHCASPPIAFCRRRRRRYSRPSTARSLSPISAAICAVDCK